MPDTLMLAVCAFGPDLPPERVAGAITRGVRAAGKPEPDVCTIGNGVRGATLNEALNDVDFDARMRRARALIVGAERLNRETLAGSPTFEIATRARQAGVPAYAITADDRLDAFDARMMDLQVVIEARGVRGLSAAGRKLAKIA